MTGAPGRVRAPEALRLCLSSVGRGLCESVGGRGRLPWWLVARTRCVGELGVMWEGAVKKARAFAGALRLPDGVSHPVAVWRSATFREFGDQGPTVRFRL